jgi:hypothetical protein
VTILSRWIPERTIPIEFWEKILVPPRVVERGPVEEIEWGFLQITEVGIRLIGLQSKVDRERSGA